MPIAHVAPAIDDHVGRGDALRAPSLDRSCPRRPLVLGGIAAEQHPEIGVGEPAPGDREHHALRGDVLADDGAAAGELVHRAGPALGGAARHRGQGFAIPGDRSLRLPQRGARGRRGERSHQGQPGGEAAVSSFHSVFSWRDGCSQAARAATTARGRAPQQRVKLRRLATVITAATRAVEVSRAALRSTPVRASPAPCRREWPGPRVTAKRPRRGEGEWFRPPARWCPGARPEERASRPRPGR